MARNTYIGAHVERVEDARFLRGRGEYIDDVTRAGLWHACILRSPHPHARIASLDTSAALAMPGVRDVMTAKDIGHPVPRIPLRVPNPDQHHAGPFQQPVIAEGVVRYVGEPIAVVLADSADVAEDALGAIAIEFEAMPLALDPHAAPDSSILFPAVGTNRAANYLASCGDVEAAFRQAAYTRRESFSVKRQTALPMETRGLMAEWEPDAGKLVVCGAAKVPFQNRKALAAMLQLPESRVDLLECDVGGGFGVRGDFYPEDFLIPFAAFRFRHPVKWIEDRREHFLAINHARDISCNIEVACDRDGTITGLRGETVVDIGAYARPSILNTVRIVAQFMSGPYRIPNISIRSYGVVSNKTPSGVYRGPGRFESSFFFERMLDIVAADLSIDRLEIRRRNLISRSEMPYPLAVTDPADGLGQTCCDSGDYSETFKRCLDGFGWKQKLQVDGKYLDGRYHGIGMGCFIEGGGAGPRENARMTIDPDGCVSVYVGSSAIGQGLETSLSQIAADALELPLERIRLLHGSTTYLHEGFGSYASRATVMGGCAIMAAAKQLRANIVAAASKRSGVEAERLTIADGAVVMPAGASLPFAELAADGICAEGTFVSSKSTYAYGAAAAHVAVDPRTGHVELLDYLVVDDVGRAINPLVLHGQLIGATVQGLGGVFGEHLVYDGHGQLLIGTLADYIAPLATDFPRIRAVTTENYPSPNNPLGAKGAGEGGIIPPGGAIANAVASALRSLAVPINSLPLSPSLVWSLIAEANNSGKRA
jgi:carbon-monoxide dehydrogenase large subunit